MGIMVTSAIHPMGESLGGAMKKNHCLPFELDEQVDDSLITGRAGVPLVAELFRASGAAEAMDENVHIKSRRRGLKSSEMAETCLRCGARAGNVVKIWPVCARTQHWLLC